MEWFLITDKPIKTTETVHSQSAATAEVTRSLDLPAARGHRPKIALFGIFGVQNLGNECTLQAMLHNVRERLPRADVFSICYEPDDTSRRYGVPAVAVSSLHHRGKQQPPSRGRGGKLRRILLQRVPAELRAWFAAVKTLRGTDLVLMTGTGMMTDYNSNALGFPYDVFKWSVAARLARCRLRFVGIGVGPIYETLSRWFIKTGAALADYRSFRDRQSRDRLEKTGVKCGHDPIVPDLAFSLPVSLFSAANLYRQRCVVGVGVMHFVDPRAIKECDRQRTYEEYLDKMCDFVIWLVERRYVVRILQGDARYDPAVRRDLRARLQQRGIDYDSAGIVDEESDSVADLLPQIQQTDFVVSPRFHNLVLALMFCKPTLSISYDPKNDALLEGFGLGEYCQPIGALNTQELIRQFLALEVRSEQLRSSIRRTVQQYRAQLDEQYAYILRETLREPIAIGS